MSEGFGTSTYFGPVEVIDHGARGYYVTGHTPDFGVPWGHYPSEATAHAAARTLHALITEYERLDSLAWRAAQARLWRWYEAQALAEHGRQPDGKLPMEVRQWQYRAERYEAGAA